MPPLLHFQILETIKTLVEVDTLMIVMMRWPLDMRELGAFLEPSLGPSTLNYEWSSTPGVDWGYGSVKFQPKRFLAERKNYQKQLWCTVQNIEKQALDCSECSFAKKNQPGKAAEGRDYQVWSSKWRMVTAKYKTL